MKFQDDISNLHTYIHTNTRTSQNQYVPHFFKVGGIKSGNSIFSIISLCFFSDAKGQLTPQSVVELRLISNSSELSCVSSLPASIIRIG